MKLKAFDSSYFSGKSHFEDDGSQNYLLFQPVYRYFKNVANSERVLAWKSKRLPDESVKPRATSDNSLPPAIMFDNIAKLRVKFKGSYSKWLMKTLALKSKSEKASKAMKFWWQKMPKPQQNRVFVVKDEMLEKQSVNMHSSHAKNS